MADLKIRCDKCGSELTYKPGTETLVCAYCGNTVRIPTQVVNPEDITDTDLIIPLQIQGDALTNATRVYMTQGQFTPDDLVQKATITKQWLKYVPFYLYHGEFHANWTASFGYKPARRVREQQPHRDGLASGKRHRERPLQSPRLRGERGRQELR